MTGQEKFGDEIMKIIQCKDYDEISTAAANEVARVIREKRRPVLGLATGSTPVGMYEKLVRMYGKGELDFSGVTSVNLDEYYPISPDNVQSYRYYMNNKLFDRVNIDKNNTYIPNGNAADPYDECAKYDSVLDSLGKIDLQVLGIGRNGHIGFNEPDESLYLGTHVTRLSDSTVKANSRFFSEGEKIPDRALTMGIGSIFKADKIILLASGDSKKDAVKQVLSGKLTTSCPATLLNLHPDVTLICDSDAM